MTQPQKRWKSVMKRALLGLGGLFVVLQFVPVGGTRTNPPVTGEPPWSSPRTRALFVRTCADCHSNETRWPWYSKVAPVSWLVAKDVREGRQHFNVSEWNRPQDDAHEAAEELAEGEMPPWFYLPLHREARLTAAEQAELVAGLQATFGGEGEKGGGGEERGRDDD